MVNNTTGLEWPRTQDLSPLYEINHAMFIASRRLYAEGRRSGSHPKLFEIDKIRAYDIDWNEDFVIAESLYKYIKKGML
jgi:N-acylneuraminate cytidylyltransferase